MALFGLFKNNKKKIKDFQSRGAIILDVRSKAEYEGGAIPGSKHIPLQQVANKVSEIKKWDKPIICCCAAGIRSGSASAILKSNGIESMNGGGWASLQKNIK